MRNKPMPLLTYAAILAFHLNKFPQSSSLAVALAESPGRDIRLLTALALARMGQPAEAETLEDKLDQEFPADTMIQSYWLPTIQASIAMHRNDVPRAIEFLKVASEYELGDPTQFWFASMYPIYVRGPHT